MIRSRILLFGTAAALLFSANVNDASAWGKREHAAIAYIAEQNLSPRAAKAVSEILEGADNVKLRIMAGLLQAADDDEAH